MSTRTFPLSLLVREQTSVVSAVEDIDVILERRGAENLVLLREERFRAMVDGLRLAARSLARIAGTNRSLAEEALAEELSWLVWLPEPERGECVAELLDQFVAGADTGRFVPFARDLVAWRHTAEVWSEPALARRLHGRLDTAEAVGLTPPQER